MSRGRADVRAIRWMGFRPHALVLLAIWILDGAMVLDGHTALRLKDVCGVRYQSHGDRA